MKTDQTYADASADLKLRWAYMSNGMVYQVAVYIQFAQHFHNNYMKYHYLYGKMAWTDLRTDTENNFLKSIAKIKKKY